MRTAQEINDTFAFHPATEMTGPMHDRVRESCRALALEFHADLRDCAERTLALRHLQQAMMFANAAVAIHGVDKPAPQVIGG